MPRAYTPPRPESQPGDSHAEVPTWNSPAKGEARRELRDGDDPAVRPDLKPGEASVDPFRKDVNNPLGFVRRMFNKDDAGGGAPEFRGKAPATRMKEYLRDPALVSRDPSAPFEELAARDTLAEATGLTGKTWTTFMFGERRRRIPGDKEGKREADDVAILGTCPLSSSLAACEWRVVEAQDVANVQFPPKARINIAFKS